MSLVTCSFSTLVLPDVTDLAALPASCYRSINLRLGWLAEIACFTSRFWLAKSIDYRVTSTDYRLCCSPLDQLTRNPRKTKTGCFFRSIFSTDQSSPQKKSQIRFRFRKTRKYKIASTLIVFLLTNTKIRTLWSFSKLFFWFLLNFVTVDWRRRRSANN